MTRNDLRLWAEGKAFRVATDYELQSAVEDALDDLKAAEAEIRLLKGIHPFVPGIPEQAAFEAHGDCPFCDQTGQWRCSLPKGHDQPCNFSLVR